MRMERSGDDCNCETLTRDDANDIGVRSNELGSRNQGIIDSHDSSYGTKMTLFRLGDFFS